MRYDAIYISYSNKSDLKRTALRNGSTFPQQKLFKQQTGN